MSQSSFTLDDAVALAAKAHAGQVDKAGQPYIEHPMRVMRRVQTDDERITAVLHDILEDTSVTVDDLRSLRCPENVIAAVVALSKHPGESLEDSMARAAADPIALVVKRADIADNSAPLRLSLLDIDTAERLRKKYDKSLALLDTYMK